MTWTKGNSGNPGGRSKNERPWRDAIQRAVKARAKGDIHALDKLARKLVALGEEGEISALKEIGDRLDGKPTQPIEGNLNINEVTDEELDARLTELMAKVQQSRKKR